MIQQANNSYSKLDEVCQQAEEHFSILLGNLKNVERLRKDLLVLRDLIDCVPLTTSEFDLTVARINNAQRYLESDEQGAAKYEIRQLVRNLRGTAVLQGSLKPSRFENTRVTEEVFALSDSVSTNG